MKIKLLIVFLIVITGTLIVFAKFQNQTKSINDLPEISISSTGFKDGESIPEIFTCKGKNISPPFQVGAVPLETKSLAIIMDDLSVAQGPYIHWLLWNMASSTTSIPENSKPDNAVTGMNSANQVSYTGPCPPSGTHTYRFQIYALDTMLDLPVGADRNTLEPAMREHILAKGQLTGTYTK